MTIAKNRIAIRGTGKTTYHHLMRRTADRHCDAVIPGHLWQIPGSILAV
jgi:hypothetical protein